MTRFNLTEKQYKTVMKRINRIYGYYLNPWMVEADFHNYL